MNIKPRYSLLTLFALTAIIAVGVKFWHGPHHIIERPSSYQEDEYIYVRDWSGNRVVNGPRVLREYYSDGRPEKIVVVYFRNGINTKNERHIQATIGMGGGFMLMEPLSELNYFEQSELEQAVKSEKQRICKAGMFYYEPEYIDQQELKKRGYVMERSGSGGPHSSRNADSK